MSGHGGYNASSKRRGLTDRARRALSRIAQGRSAQDRRPRRFESLEARLALDATVVFNEILYNPLGSDESGEFIELHNQNAVPVDISAWRIEGGVDVQFPEGTIMPGGSYLVVAADPQLALQSGALNVLPISYSGRLDNSGEALRLVERSDRLMDQVEYNDRGKWPEAADGSGASLAKINPQSASDKGPNWTSSLVVGGTPGRKNFADDAGVVNAVETLVADRSTWKYDDTNVAPPANWNESSFSDAPWSSGGAIFAAGTGSTAAVQASLIEDVTATPSSDLAGFDRGAEHLVDGSGLSGNTHTNAPDGYMWLNQGSFTSNPPAPSDLDPFIVFDLGAVHHLDQMKVWNYNEVAGTLNFSLRGIASADILVAGENQVFSTFAAGQAFTVAPGLSTDFAQTIDFGGLDVRYIRLENMTNHGGDSDFVGLSEVQFFGTPLPETTLAAGADAYYFRQEFEFDGPLSRVDGLSLNVLADDGAVFYLNGVEIYRHNMPGGTIAHATRSTTSVGDAAWTLPIDVPFAALQEGTNLLAVEVHQATAADGDMLFDASLSVEIAPSTAVESTLIESDDTWLYAPIGGDLGTAWSDPSFDDSSWISHAAPLEAGTSTAAGIITGVSATPSTEFTAFGGAAMRLAAHAVSGGGLVGSSHVFNPPQGTMWLSSAGDIAPTITFDLGATYNVNDMRIWNYNENANATCCLTRSVKNFNLFFAGDDGVFPTLPDVSVTNFAIAPGTTSDFSQTISIGGEARYIKMVVLQNWGDGTYTGLSEVQFTGVHVSGVRPIPTTVDGASSSFQNGGDVRLASATTDTSGLYGDGHSTYYGTMWLTRGTFFGTQNDLSPQITYDLGSVRPVEEMKVWNYNEFDPALPPATNAQLLGRGVATAEILVAGEDRIFSTLIASQPFGIAPGSTTTDYAQTIDLGGLEARYVRIRVLSSHNGKDFTTPGSPSVAADLVGLSEVRFYEDAVTQVGDLPLDRATYYFRDDFLFGGNPGSTELTLNAQIDGGAVFFLNDVEVYRYNMPEGPFNHDTFSLVESEGPESIGPISIPAASLVSGNNVLAVEVHQSPGFDFDMSFSAELIASTTPELPPERTVGLLVNEIAGAGDSPWFVELVNAGDAPIELGGVRVESSTGQFLVLPSQTLNPGALRSIPASELGFTPVEGDKIFIKDSTASLVYDGAAVTDRLRGRLALDEWLFPSAASPGATNVFSLHDEIAINEIMYHYQAPSGTSTTPGVYNTTSLIPIDGVWRYNASGADLGTAWATTAHSVGGDWQSGPGAIGFDTAALTPPILTAVADPSTNDPPIITYYMEREFTFTGNPADFELQLSHMVDDGAVFYLNGFEVYRYNMPDGTITAATPSNLPAVDNAVLSDPISLPKDHLQVGTNRLSVEVHQQSAIGSDIVMGAVLTASETIVAPIPGVVYTEDPEEWIELYNRSGSTVDVSGWRLDDAVEYTFPPGTTIASGEYVVVARDAAALAIKHPTIRILGDFSGRLDNRDERVTLLDDSDNPADTVHYYEDGRWSSVADGGGSSLELRDPNADNSRAEAWAASDESGRSSWQTYTYRGVAAPSAVGPDGQFQEFVLGLLDSGAVLLDNISVVQFPGTGSAAEVIVNGSFEGDTVGSGAAAWRIIGNHAGQIVDDPDNPGNKALRLVATGQAGHLHNHAETTLSTPIVNGREYEITFDAKWIAGSNQVNTRLYFNRLPETTLIERPTVHGTPGMQNSTFTTNLGPTYAGMIHIPVVPEPGEATTVSLAADDPNGLAAMTLWYSVGGGSWQSVAMAFGSDGRYAASIPGQAAGTVVQFYVEGEDGLGATSTFPRDGVNSRALYKVDDGLASATGIHNLRIILTPGDAALLYQTNNLMSSGSTGATVIYNENEVFYDAGVRLSGSQRARPFTERTSYRVSFGSDHLFRGVFSSFILDRSDSVTFGQREILLHTSMGRAGGLPAEYNDLIHIMPPSGAHVGGAELQMSRYSDTFLDSQYENGADGSLYEYELIYYPLTTDAGGFKLPQPDGVVGVPIVSLGNDPENYRWTYEIKNRRAADDYDPIVAFATTMGLTGSAYFNAIESVLNVDQYLRAAAFATASGFHDQYATGDAHNAQFYFPPGDSRAQYFPHDLDAFFNAATPIVANADVTKLIANPNYAHAYYGHLYDVVTAAYNGDYMAQFTSAYATLLPAQNWDGRLSEVIARSTFVLNQLRTTVSPTGFEITSADGQILAQDFVVLQGTGWVDVAEIRIAGSSAPLEINWTTASQWQATVPLVFGANAITLEAYDLHGNLLGSDAISVESTVSERPLEDFLRIVEVMYHPADPTAAEETAGFTDDDDFEFVELFNTSTTETLDLSGVRFTEGIQFTFGEYFLGPLERVVVAQNQAALIARYGAILNLAGQYGQTPESYRLDNGGERIRLATPAGATILDFTYDDAWYPTTDGDGYSLVVVNASADVSNWGLSTGWKASGRLGGSPGAADAPASDLNNDDIVGLADLAILQRHFGMEPATVADGDLDDNGRVGRRDIVSLLADYGFSAESAAPSPVASSSAVPLAAAVDRIHTASVDRRRSPASRTALIAAEAQRHVIRASRPDGLRRAAIRARAVDAWFNEGE